MENQSDFLEQVRSAIPKDAGISLTAIGNTIILQAKDGNKSNLLRASDDLWEVSYNKGKPFAVSAEMVVGSREEESFRQLRHDIEALFPREGVYVVIEKKSADKPST
jgi:hypothetical protein